MTTVAWDGKTLASDRQMTHGNLAVPVTKIKKLQGVLVATAGSSDRAALLFDWVLRGRREKQWPLVQEGLEAELLIIEADGTISLYEWNHKPVVIELPFYAIGSGRDFAVAALHLGADARRAVEIASIYDIGTGLGIDTLTL